MGTSRSGGMLHWSLADTTRPGPKFRLATLSSVGAGGLAGSVESKLIQEWRIYCKGILHFWLGHSILSNWVSIPNITTKLLIKQVFQPVRGQESQTCSDKLTTATVADTLIIPQNQSDGLSSFFHFISWNTPRTEHSIHLLTYLDLGTIYSPQFPGQEHAISTQKGHEPKNCSLNIFALWSICIMTVVSTLKRTNTGEVEYAGNQNKSSWELMNLDFIYSVFSSCCFFISRLIPRNWQLYYYW